MKKFVRILPLFLAVLVGAGAAVAAHPGKPFTNTLKYYTAANGWQIVPSGKTVSCDNVTTINCHAMFDSDNNIVPGTLVTGNATLH